jgi:hypothetical protein
MDLDNGKEFEEKDSIEDWREFGFSIFIPNL